jgi:hypothetical protein
MATDEQIQEKTTWGWLRPYLIMLDEMFLKRWDYWLRTVNAGQVLDEPIPQVEWQGTGHEEPAKNLEACIESCRNVFSRQAFNLFVEWLLFAFGDPSIKEMPRQIDAKVNAFWYKAFNLSLFLKYPYDYPGRYAADLYGNKHNATAYFPTPMNVSMLMAKMLFSEGIKKTASVCDPCVGSGRLLMAASNYSLNLYGVDIDCNILNVCKANMWMYVPWGVFRPEIKGLEPAEPMKQQDSLAVHPIQQTTPEVQKKLLEFAGLMDLFQTNGR